MSGGAATDRPAPPEVDRAFLRVSEGLVHYRHAGEATAAAPYTVLYAHPGPKASAHAPLVAEIARTRRVIAPDRLGTGDAAAPAVADPDIRYFADSIVRQMDALKIDTVDYFGSHTGGYMGIELLIHHPDRIRKAVLDGLAVRTDADQKMMYDNYAPPMEPDIYGRQFTWAFQYVRDQSLHFPHFLRDPAHYSNRPLASAESIHGNVVDILKSLTTYHLAYRAVFSHDTAAKLAMIKENVVPTMIMTSVEDGEHEYLDDIARRLPWAKKVSVPGGWAGRGVVSRAQGRADFLDA